MPLPDVKQTVSLLSSIGNYLKIINRLQTSSLRYRKHVR